ncbi:MAG: hypothetical protein PX481_06460 [Microcystis sp. M53603_WE2]|nr:MULTISPECIES: hypothetical protein [Microcystis]MCZ8027946.1 hypothetical protein [Microcystis sp. LE19-10.1B]MCZ8364726.1 hypothetical protein [Microcystis sp. LE19-251.1A]MDJ0525580.1 hypothetical protein [Microcystis sp. M53600_WE12]MCZ8049292.1 hypothetical protein [Microcystis sp. LE19-41.2A]MCZ8291722.1 hypothetical protein [Microcystis sp. LE19-59.1C]
MTTQRTREPIGSPSISNLFWKTAHKIIPIQLTLSTLEIETFPSN